MGRGEREEGGVEGREGGVEERDGGGRVRGGGGEGLRERGKERVRKGAA